MVDPGRSFPSCSALRIIPLAARSLMLPPGFMNSALPRISQPVSRESESMRRSGVFPTASQSFPTFMPSALPAAPRSGPAAPAPRLDAEQRRHQRVDVLAGVVRRERGAHRALEAEPAQDGLGAVV